MAIVQKKLPNDIMVEMKGLEERLKIKPRVFIGVGRVPISATEFSEKNHVTINCPVAYKRTLGQVLLMLADPNLPRPVIPSPLVIQSMEIKWHISAGGYSSLLKASQKETDNLTAVTVLSFSRDLFNAEINLSTVENSVPRKIFRILRDSGMLYIERTQQYDTCGKFYLICHKRNEDLVQRKSEMICNYLSTASLDALDACKQTFNSAPRVEGSTRTFLKPSQELIDLTQDAVKKNPIPKNITIPPASFPPVNAWNNPFGSSFRSNARYNDNNNATNDDALTTTSGITEAQTIKTLQTQLTSLQTNFDNFQQKLEKAESDREKAEVELKRERERERKQDRIQRDKEEEERRAQRAKEEAEYRKQREREAKIEQENIRARLTAVENTNKEKENKEREKEKLNDERWDTLMKLLMAQQNNTPQNSSQDRNGMMIEPTSTHPPSQLTNSISSSHPSETNDASNDLMNDTMRDSSLNQNRSSLRAQVALDKASNSSSKRDEIDLLAARREVNNDREIFAAGMKRSSDNIEQDDDTAALAMNSKRIETQPHTVNVDHTMNDPLQQTIGDVEDEQNCNNYHMDDDLSGIDSDVNNDDDYYNNSQKEIAYCS